jgi:predicted transcriptional regulator of viral defense system
MANKSRFIIAESSIKAFFKENAQKVFSREEIKRIFEARRGLWNLPLSTTAERFAEQLVRREVLKIEKIEFESYAGTKERFVVEGTSPFQVATSLMPKAYLSHYTAVFLNGLTTQVPKNIYISFEQSKKNNVDRTLEQAAIDSAFSRPQRSAGSRAHYQGYTLVLLTSMHAGRVGVTTIDNLPVTGIERTLIDGTVRPAYSGGVQAVLDAYQKALPELSMNKLLATLKTMDFIYPYHQSIGFYLERASYSSKQLEKLHQMPREFDFYLTYEMQDPAYSKEWRLYYPRGM